MTLGKHVLIAEDEPHLTETLRFLLEREGYHVTATPDGEAALLRMWQTLPDLVILDVMLPVMNGFDILRRIRADRRLEKLPVIILTAKGQRQDQDTALALGADIFLTKPFANKDVIATVNQLIEAR